MGAASGSSVPFFHKQRDLFHAVGDRDDFSAADFCVRPEIKPVAGKLRRDEYGIAEPKFIVDLARFGIVRPIQNQRAHRRFAGDIIFVERRIEIRNELIRSCNNLRTLSATVVRSDMNSLP
jgi:hypothetical protein